MPVYEFDLYRYGSARVKADSLEEARQKVENRSEYWQDVDINDYQNWHAEGGFELEEDSPEEDEEEDA